MPATADRMLCFAYSIEQLLGAFIVKITPEELQYLIRKTVTYLEFHNDNSAMELVAQWQEILARIDRLKQQKRSL